MGHILTIIPTRKMADKELFSTSYRKCRNQETMNILVYIALYLYWDMSLLRMLDSIQTEEGVKYKTSFDTL